MRRARPLPAALLADPQPGGTEASSSYRGMGLIQARRGGVTGRSGPAPRHALIHDRLRPWWPQVAGDCCSSTGPGCLPRSPELNQGGNPQLAADLRNVFWPGGDFALIPRPARTSFRRLAGISGGGWVRSKIVVGSGGGPFFSLGFGAFYGA